MAILIDPDKLSVQAILSTVYTANEAGVQMILVGGSLMSTRIDSTIEIIKKNSDIPVVLFPGSLMQLSAKADALLLLSLVSGRNPEYLIGNHVLAAPYIRTTNLEVIPTGYILIQGGNVTSVEYISNTRPIPADKKDLIVATALASEMLGHKLIYLEAGSGAKIHVSLDVVSEVKRRISIPLIVGGGITSSTIADEILEAGADMIVVGTAVEKNVEKINQMMAAIKNY
ncbi:MAG: geranylgeranylglyceryl/heptaprenylglyceryl phosphate synthase [Bacteroidales bacterium]|nr:geranylgeranylglyceryl/heptaprenylglyceryl phosphate synthase [Bacteroidales bacterium]MBN2819333.1 geranylgeranylglyceryl/heptaprenylglyceryl phosphate synthase [Bacteroidales bacterium]